MLGLHFGSGVRHRCARGRRASGAQVRCGTLRCRDLSRQRRRSCSSFSFTEVDRPASVVVVAAGRAPFYPLSTASVPPSGFRVLSPFSQDVVGIFLPPCRPPRGSSFRYGTRRCSCPSARKPSVSALPWAASIWLASAHLLVEWIEMGMGSRSRAPGFRVRRFAEGVGGSGMCSNVCAAVTPVEALLPQVLTSGIYLFSTDEMRLFSAFATTTSIASCSPS